MAIKKLSTVSKILVYQLLIITLAVLGFAVVQGWQQAFSSVLGGLTAFIPNAYFGWKIRSAAGKTARKAVNTFYIGEVGKWVLTIALFVVDFKIPNVNIFPLLATYMMAISVFWFALLMR